MHFKNHLMYRSSKTCLRKSSVTFQIISNLDRGIKKKHPYKWFIYLKPTKVLILEEMASWSVSCPVFTSIDYMEIAGKGNKEKGVFISSSNGTFSVEAPGWSF